MCVSHRASFFASDTSENGHSPDQGVHISWEERPVGDKEVRINFRQDREQISSEDQNGCKDDQSDAAGESRRSDGNRGQR